MFNTLATSASGITTQQSCNYQLPVAEVTASGNTAFCVGGSVDLTASGNYDFAWSTGATSNSITVVESEDYSVVVNDAYDCKDTSSLIMVEVYSNPHPAILSTNDFELCEEESSVLYVQQNFSAYQWSDGSMDSVFTADVAGDYFVEVLDDSVCSGVSDTVSVIINTPPATPMVEFIGDTLLVTTGNYLINWYLNNSLITGASDDFYIPVSNGDYYVVVTDSNGCNTSSANFNVLLTGIKIISENVLVYPNPTNGKIFIGEKVERVILYDVMGKVVGIYFSQKIMMEKIPAGIYYLEMLTGQHRSSFHHVVKR